MDSILVRHLFFEYSSQVLILLGPIQSYSRSVYSVLVPKGKETLFFSLFEISDKGSSWMGPLVVGALNQGIVYMHCDHIRLIVPTAFGSMRYGVLYILGMILLSLPIMYFVDVEKVRQRCC